MSFRIVLNNSIIAKAINIRKEKPTRRLGVLGPMAVALCIAVLLHGNDRVSMMPVSGLIADPSTLTAVPTAVATSGGIQVEPFADYQIDADCAAKVKEIRTADNSTQPLYERYRDLRVIDSHNHGATNTRVTLKLQDQYYVDRIILFGNISEPTAVVTDQVAFSVYAQHPDKVYPFFAGIPLYGEVGMAMT